MNYVKEIYTGTEDKLNSVAFARIDDLAFFIVHDFDNNCDICYNLRLSKFFLSSYLKKEYKIINLKSYFEFPFKLRYYVFGAERDFIFSADKAQTQIVKYITLKKRICFNPQKYGTVIHSFSDVGKFSTLTIFRLILTKSGVDTDCFCAAYLKPIYFSYIVTDLKKFKVAVTKYKILYPDDTVIVNFH